MYANLLLLLRYNLRLLLHKLDVLKILHLLIDHFLLEPEPNLIGDAEVVNTSADCIRGDVLSLARVCSASGRKERIWE